LRPAGLRQGDADAGLLLQVMVANDFQQAAAVGVQSIGMVITSPTGQPVKQQALHHLGEQGIHRDLAPDGERQVVQYGKQLVLFMHASTGWQMMHAL
jgi:hypothetical protein